MKVILILKNDFPATISTRKVMTEYCLKLHLSSINEYVLDFSEISFISRSCVDEFVKIFSNAGCKWSLINFTANIKSMFDAVSHTQSNKQHEFENVAVIPFLNQPELNKFLEVI